MDENGQRFSLLNAGSKINRWISEHGCFSEERNIHAFLWDLYERGAFTLNFRDLRRKTRAARFLWLDLPVCRGHIPATDNAPSPLSAPSGHVPETYCRAVSPVLPAATLWTVLSLPKPCAAAKLQEPGWTPSRRNYRMIAAALLAKTMCNSAFLRPAERPPAAVHPVALAAALTRGGDARFRTEKDLPPAAVIRCAGRGLLKEVKGYESG